MSQNQGKKYLFNYFAMAFFVMCAYLAFKLSGTLAGVLSIIALLIANPAMCFPAEKLRWILLLLLFILIVFTIPDLMQLKVLESTASVSVARITHWSIST